MSRDGSRKAGDWALPLLLLGRGEVPPSGIFTVWSVRQLKCLQHVTGRGTTALYRTRQAEGDGEPACLPACLGLCTEG